MTTGPPGGPSAGLPNGLRTGPATGPGGESPGAKTDIDRWRRVRALFEDAVDRDASEWPRILETAADDERELLAQLLAADGASESLLDRTPDQLAADLLDRSEPVPDRIDRYRIIRPIGRGGMGQVLLARRDDGSYDQEVAIKVVRRGMDSEDVLRRFRAERQILAGLKHPNIATLLDGGITEDGRPYFVLEFVAGLPITDYCETHDLPLEARLELFATTCAAVEYAHARGIIHRDLKPRNIIVAAATPPAVGTVKLLDFGIARLLDAGSVDFTVALTRTGSRLMTPEYASPEQLKGGRVGSQSDVYSLGVVLHELVTGRRPHDLQGVALGDIERVVCEQPVTLTARDAPHVPAALRSIILMALRKEPERRYATAGDLGDDVRRFAAGEAVFARGDSITYRVGSFVRRRTAGIAMSVAAMAVLVAVVVVGVAYTASGTRLAATAAVATSSVGTSDAEAYRFYVRGNEFFRFNEDESRLRLAEASYLEAVARDSTFAEAWAKLSATHTQMWFHHFDRSDERLDRAQRTAELALRLHPELPESYYALGVFLYQGRGDLHQAERYFQRALELNPEHIQSMFFLAAVLRRQGRLEEAIGYFEQLAILDTMAANHLFSIAFSRQLLRQYEEAEPLYVDAISHAADLPLIYAVWARLRLSRTGSVDEARGVLAQGAGAALDNDFTRYVAADLDLMSGRYREVLREAAGWRMDVLDSQSWYVPVAWLRAAAYRGLEEPDSARAQEQLALRLLEQRVASEPDDGRAHSALGRVYAALGRDDDAIRSALRGVELTPYNRDAVLAPFRMEDLAAVYVLTGRLEDAMTTIDSLLSVPGLISPRHLHADPLWAPLREHPRFPPGT